MSYGRSYLATCLIVNVIKVTFYKVKILKKNKGDSHLFYNTNKHLPEVLVSV